MANTELMDTEDELKFYRDVHAILDEAKSCDRGCRHIGHIQYFLE